MQTPDKAPQYGLLTYVSRMHTIFHSRKWLVQSDAFLCKVKRT